jgi:hypothetical protein
VEECGVDRLRSVVVSVRDLDIVPDESWAYIWVRSLTKSVIYVGATGVHPSLRTWLHLNHTNPEVARVAKRFTDIGGDITEEFFVVGYVVPPQLSRAEVRDAVVDALSSTSALDALFAGDRTVSNELGTESVTFAAAIVTDLLSRLS